MSEINSRLIEKYQMLLKQQPQSKVFAPLAEAYRRLKLLPEAKAVCEQGIHHNPEFASGRVAFARVLFDLSDFEKAKEHLLRAVELSPENLLANNLLADTYLRLKQPKEALRAFKMVLLLNPNNQRAAQAVQKLESLTADEYEAELFEMKSLTQTHRNEVVLDSLEEKSQKIDELAVTPHSLLERYLSLADAYTVRNEIEKAIAALEKASDECGEHREIRRRLSLLNQRHPNRDKEQEQIAKLRQWLDQIEKRRHVER